MKHKLKWLLILVLGTITGVILIALTYVSFVVHEIDTRMAQLRSTQTTKFYAKTQALKKGDHISEEHLLGYLEDQGFKRTNDEDPSVGEFVTSKNESELGARVFRPLLTGPGFSFDQHKVLISLEKSDTDRFIVKAIKNEDSGEELEHFEGTTKVVGHYFAERLRTQSSVPLSDIPVSLRFAVMAIEDTKFLEHHGVSIRAIVRAIWKDILARKFVQGGSTITQQLMKNLFFSRDKVLSRKFKEMFFALVTESRHNKEDILEAYLNEVYLGQWGTHEIHGVSEASRYYFNRSLESLTLGQSATLAAIIQAPNLYDLRRQSTKALDRRNRVLQKMLEAEFILPDEYESALKESLSVVPEDKSLEDAHYLLDLAMDRMPAPIKERLNREALSIELSLQPNLQNHASRILKSHLGNLESYYKRLKDLTKKGVFLQGALIAMDVKECSIIALQGGRNYRQTQFNRVTQGFRQAGSLFKPFVYLAALNDSDEFTPITMLEDKEFEWTYEKQSWKPRNYDETFRGPVTLKRALIESLNVPTAQVAFKVGVPMIVDVLVKAGIQSKLPEVPSVSLGSADVSPYELAIAYLTLSRLGKKCEPTTFSRIYDENKNLLYENPRNEEETLPERASFQTVHLLKSVFTEGTARSALESKLSLDSFAGKTGTTNDYKDAWFVGFSPQILTLVWVGYDEKETLGLTGSQAALPIWVDFIKEAPQSSDKEDFTLVEGLEKYEIEKRDLSLANDRCPEKYTEYFVPGTQPKFRCSLH